MFIDNFILLYKRAHMTKTTLAGGWQREQYRSQHAPSLRADRLTSSRPGRNQRDTQTWTRS